MIPVERVKASRSPRAVTQARAEEARDDCARTGQPLTTALLAERLSISPGYARRLVRDLNDQAAEVNPGAAESGLRAVNQ
ncbi:MAG: hypothetical protein QOJ11_1771 [Frankiales bacterium]|nr:hypothetical protein [Frankiales bacterium]